MKKKILTPLTFMAAFLVVMAFACSAKIGSSSHKGNPPQEKPDPGFPKNVSKVIETSCFDCHTNASSNIKAKKKLNFSKWNELSDARKIARMDDICSIINKDKMPPSKYLSKYPDRALNAEQKAIVCKWTNDETKKLMGE